MILVWGRAIEDACLLGKRVFNFNARLPTPTSSLLLSSLLFVHSFKWHHHHANAASSSSPHSTAGSLEWMSASSPFQCQTSRPLCPALSLFEASPPVLWSSFPLSPPPPTTFWRFVILRMHFTPATWPCVVHVTIWQVTASISSHGNTSDQHQINFSSSFLSRFRSTKTPSCWSSSCAACIDFCGQKSGWIKSIHGSCSHTLTFTPSSPHDESPT